MIAAAAPLFRRNEKAQWGVEDEQPTHSGAIHAITLWVKRPIIRRSARGYLADLSYRLRSGIVGRNGTIASVPWISMQARRVRELTHLPLRAWGMIGLC